MRFAARTHQGNVRDRNEDSVLTMPEIGLFMVADGMGGHSFGDRASRMAVDRAWEYAQAASAQGVPDASRRREVLLEAFQEAHEDIRRFVETEAEGKTVGTTGTALWLQGAEAAVAHIGDSRLYLLRAGEIQLMTHDHTMVQEFVEMERITPEQAKESPYSHMLTRAVGIKKKHDPETSGFEMEAGDVMLLCSDGLYGVVEDKELNGILQKATSEPLELLADQLVNTALQRGGPDNVSFIIVSQ
jgi:serine/threonine protein phosphatase PrpC